METAQAHQTAKHDALQVGKIAKLQKELTRSVTALSKLSESIQKTQLTHTSRTLDSNRLTDLQNLSQSEQKLKKDISDLAITTNNLVKWYNKTVCNRAGMLDPKQLTQNLETLDWVLKKIDDLEATGRTIQTANDQFLKQSQDSSLLVSRNLTTLFNRITNAVNTAFKVFNTIKRDAHNVRTGLSNFSSSQTVVASSDETGLSLLAPSAPSTKTLQPQPKPNDPRLIAKFNRVANEAKVAVREEMREFEENLDNLESTIGRYDEFLNQERPIGISTDRFQPEKRLVQQAKLEAIKNLEKLRTEYESIPNSKTLYREKIVAYIRHELEGSQFTSDKKVPREVKLAAIPLDKKDTLISNKTLISKILGSKFTDANFDLRVYGDGSISLENRQNGSKLSLVKADDGRMRVTITKDRIEQRLGTAWNDDALKLCERFAQGSDLGILRGGTPANREYYIPSANFLKDNPAQPHKDNSSTARKTGSLVRF
jgi:hypothetical protein